MQREETRQASRLAAVIALAFLAGAWSWWAAKEGAYFGTVAYPGIVVLCLGFMIVSSRSAWQHRLVLPTPAKVGIGALVGLAIWSALSAIWSPAPDVAVADAQRILGYAVAFGLGVWVTALVGDRAHLAITPLAFAGLFAGVVAVVGMLTGDELARYVDEGTLQYPLGYRNANAAFFLIATWSAAALAASRALDWRLRALAAGAGTLCLELAMLSQSRGSLVAAVLALAVYLAVSRERARALAWLALLAAAAVVVIPALTDLYATADREAYQGTTELRAAGRAALGGAGLALALAAAAAFAGRRLAPSQARTDLGNRAVAGGGIVLIVAAAIVFVAVTRDPAGWIDDRVDEFLTQGTPGAEEASSRFTLNAGSERDDLWRVALDDGRSEPLLGTGGGGYHYSYLVNRGEDGIESVRDAHSVELEIFSELGAPGLTLFVIALGGLTVAAWRARRAGIAAAALSTCALTVTVYWLVHASTDWFWMYPALTAPVFALLGSACAPGAASETTPATRWRRAAAIAAAALALSLVPPYLAERYLDAAYQGWRSDPGRASADLERAHNLNPLAIEPFLAAGAIAKAQGESTAAIASFEQAAEERPEEWAPHYFLATLHRRSDPERAAEELRLALDLNPLSFLLAELRERLRASRDRP